MTSEASEPTSGPTPEPTPGSTPEEPGERAGARASAPARTSAARRAGAKREKRPSLAARRAGYLVSVAALGVLLWLIHVNPGWSAAAFLTDDAEQVVSLVTLSLVVSIVVNLIWAVHDPVWLRALGDLVTGAIGIVVCARLLDVFPFPLDEESIWHTVVTMGLWVGLIGSAISVIVNLVVFIRALMHLPTGRPAD
jgi:hypothetical protein